jgi:hypothetical protein
VTGPEESTSAYWIFQPLKRETARMMSEELEDGLETQHHLPLAVAH